MNVKEEQKHGENNQCLTEFPSKKKHINLDILKN